MRERLALPLGFTLFYAGRVSKDKNLDFLIQVYQALARRDQDVNLVIAGDGPWMEELRARVGNDPHVRILGHVAWHRLPEHYALADVFLFPSTTDTYGMAALEAMACGIPVLVADIGGPQHLVHDGATGHILPADDLSAWVGALQDLRRLSLIESGAYEAMRRRARRRAMEHFSWAVAFDALLDPPPFEGKGLWPEEPDMEEDAEKRIILEADPPFPGSLFPQNRMQTVAE
jgi:glycosyltransferase involved in cell wall biosynthesis